MDHVISSLYEWIAAFEESEPDDTDAITCIENAIKELNKYYR